MDIKKMIVRDYKPWLYRDAKGGLGGKLEEAGRWSKMCLLVMARGPNGGFLIQTSRWY